MVIDAVGGMLSPLILLPGFVWRVTPDRLDTRLIAVEAG